MDENNSIQLFEDRKIRTAWDEEQEEWYFSVVDVIAVLTDSSNPTDYLKKMRKRDEQLASYLGTNCPQVTMMGATGKKRKVLAATAEQLLRIIQSIPSPKAEPFKLWLAQVGRERIEETIDPEQAIDRALETYQKKGYDTDWIHQRLLSIRVRNELTAEWQERGVQQGKEYAILTDEITKAWSGMTNPGDWNDHRFREVSDHRKDAAVPCQRRLAHFTGDLAYFGIDRIEHARQVSRDPLDEQPSEPFIEFVEYAAHKRSPPDDQPNRPESRGTRVMPMRATPPPAINCFIPK